MNQRQRMSRFTFLMAFALISMTTMAVQTVQGQDNQKLDNQKQKNMIQGEFVAPADSFPRVHYYESDKITLNDRCPVRKVPLNPKMTPVYVNGQPIGFC